MGLGLYLAREILTKQGGYIKVASQPGKGCVFSLYLPRENANPEKAGAGMPETRIVSPVQGKDKR